MCGGSKPQSYGVYRYIPSFRKTFFRLEKKLTFAFETTASTADFDIFDVYLLSDLRRRFKVRVEKDKRSEHEI